MHIGVVGLGSRGGEHRTSTAPTAPHIPFLDLARSQEPLSAELDAVWEQVTRSVRYVGGGLVAEFEKRWAAYCGCSHAVGVANGTDAIELALRGLGVGPGDEVVVPANTFVATAAAVVATGAIPVFVDVDPQTLVVTPETVAPALGDRTAAVVVVHLYGHAADAPALLRQARAAGVHLVEDCAQAHGASWDGRPVGSFGDAGCFSFYPGKNLGAFGDGGAVVTSDAELAGRVRVLADHGRRHGSRYLHDAVGRNSRLDALQAGVLAVKLGHLESWNAERRGAAARYVERLGRVPGVGLLAQSPASRSVHHLFPVLVDDRDAVQERLAEAGVETAIHYPVPCPDNPGYSAFRSSSTTVVRSAASRLLSLPMFPGITTAEIDRISAALAEAVAGPR